MPCLSRDSPHMQPLLLPQKPPNCAPPTANMQSDITIYVGKNRTPYSLSIDTLRASSFFRSLLDRRSSNPPSLVIDCEESVFQNMITILRYGSFAALPKLSEPELFKLRKELEFYGIDFPSRIDSSSSSSSPASTSPRSSSEARHFSLFELPGFPAELADPSKLVLVSRFGENASGKCPCSPDQKPSFWALNFFHRHAFCTACGRPPASLAPKFLAEMFMVAAAYFAGEKLDPKKWSVGCDSTCTLKFASSNSCCSCSCSSNNSVWAASTYHSHAFCTQCGKCAEGSALVCILLSLRYGGHHRSPKGKRENHADLPIARGMLASQPDPCRTPSRTPSYGSQRSA